MNRFASFLLASLLLGSVSAPLAAQATSGAVDGIEDRLDERLPRVVALKAAGTLGENNRGLLEPRGTLSPEDARLVAGVNQDRGRVYATVAQRSGASVDEVARSRARQIAQRSPGGVWLQAPDGTWYRKP